MIDTFKISKALVQDERLSDEQPFGSQGGAVIRYYFPLDAECSIKVLLRRQECDYIIGMGEAARDRLPSRRRAPAAVQRSAAKRRG